MQFSLLAYVLRFFLTTYTDDNRHDHNPDIDRVLCFWFRRIKFLQQRN